MLEQVKEKSIPWCDLEPCLLQVMINIDDIKKFLELKDKGYITVQ